MKTVADPEIFKRGVFYTNFRYKFSTFCFPLKLPHPESQRTLYRPVTVEEMALMGGGGDCNPRSPSPRLAT